MTTRVGYVDGWDITLEKFNYSTSDWCGAERWRPVLVEGTLVNKRQVGKRDAYASPVALNNDTRPEGTDAGHVVGLQLGGPDHDYNLVPMYSAFNQGTWKALETRVKLFLGTYQSLDVTVAIGYPTLAGSWWWDARIPSRFEFTVTQYDKLILREQHEHGALAAYKIGVGDYGGLVQVIDSAQKAMEQAGWMMEDVWPDFGDVLPPEDARPYAVLDYLLFEKEHPDFPQYPGSISKGRGFSDSQKDDVRLVNRLRNEGWLRSDDPYNDPYAGKNLLRGPGDYGAQIDHIVSMTPDGPNVFSNAQVISGKWNQSKGASKL